MAANLRIRASELDRLRAHLFPADHRESVAFALCGRHHAKDLEILLVHDLQLVHPEQSSRRKSDLDTRESEYLEPLLTRASKLRLSVVQFRGRADGCCTFSEEDDQSDLELLTTVRGIVGGEGPHGSVVVLPGGTSFGRLVSAKGDFTSLDRITVIGDEIAIHGIETDSHIPSFAQRHAQVFGRRTTSLLRHLAIGVVGCSGTGGLVVEMLARLGAGRLILVDPDRVEYRNLNRIVGTTARDAALNRPKVEALAEHVASIGLGTEVVTVGKAIATREAVIALAGCDIVFGCMDSHDGRRTLNRLAQHYLLPYFDCGVSLDGDGVGGIDKVVAASHYYQPGASTALERHAINIEKARAEAIARDTPAEYARLHAQGYIEGANEDRPAVISVNALAASLCVNEMLARLHPFRGGKNREYASFRFDLTEMSGDSIAEQGTTALPPYCGIGDTCPLLGMPDLSAP